jgi:hypothetical protein
MNQANDIQMIVVALVKDLFFSVKLGNELRGHGYEPRFVKTVGEFRTRLEEDEPVLGIIDIDAVSDWEQIANLAANTTLATIPLLAFGPHKDIEGRRAAKAAGIARILSNSQFHAEAPLYVQRYARRSIQPPPGLR